MRSSACLIFIVAILLLIGVVMLVSTSGPQGEKLFNNPYHFIIRHIMWLVLGIAAAIVGARVDYRRWIRLAWPLLGVTLVLLALVYVPKIGLNIKGSHRWIRLPLGLTFQPSEIAKFTAIVLLSMWYGRKRRQRNGFKAGILTPGILLGLMLVLIVFETDFGATILIGGTGVMMMFVAGAPLGYLLPVALAGGGVLGWMIWNNPERKARISTFMEPDKYAQGEGYQLINALYGFVAGGPWGAGLGKGLQKQHYLPEAHTDFIFAIIGEELGIIASIGVVVLFVCFMLCGLRISGRAADVQGRLMAFGITMLITFQAAINIGVVIGWLPTKGLPLPFISFGGTSLMVTLFMVGVLINIARQSPVAKKRAA